MTVAGVKFRRIALPEVALHVAEAGPETGPPTILLHGFPESWYGWRHQIGPLAETGLRIIAPDQRGYGLSDKPAGIAAYHLDRLAGAFGHFLTLYMAGGRRAVPPTDAEFHVDEAAPRPGRPAIAVSGTPDQIISALQQVMEATGARRLLVETFSREEARLFAREVIPALRQGR